MPTPIDARVTPSLHSENVRQLDGYSDDSAPYLGPVMETLDDAYLTLGKIHDARDHASRNQAWTPEQAVIAVSDAAYKQQQRLLSKFDKLSKMLTAVDSRTNPASTAGTAQHDLDLVSG